MNRQEYTISIQYNMKVVASGNPTVLIDSVVDLYFEFTLETDLTESDVLEFRVDYLFTLGKKRNATQRLRIMLSQ